MNSLRKGRNLERQCEWLKEAEVYMKSVTSFPREMAGYDG